MDGTWEYHTKSLSNKYELSPVVSDVEEDIRHKISIARNETKQLQLLIDRIKSKTKDANLVQMSNGIASIIKNRINLSSPLSLSGHHNKIADFRWSSDSSSILSASQDGFLILWDATSGLKKNAVPLDSQWVLTCAINNSGHLVASAGLTNNCTIYRISHENRIQQQIVSIFKGHTCYISSVEFMGNNRIITGSGDMTCALWDIPRAKRITEYVDHLGDVLSVAIPPNRIDSNETIFISGGSDGYVRVWDTRMLSAAQSFFVSESDISTVRFFNNGETIITGSDDGVARMFDLRSDCLIGTYSLTQQLQQQGIQKGRQYSVSHMDYAVSSGLNSYSPTARSVGSSHLDSQGIVSLDFSASGRLMYACYTDFGCVIWDTLKGDIVGKLNGHAGRISGVRSSPNGMAVCTGSWDSTMKVWSPNYL